MYVLYLCFFVDRKEEGMSVEPTFSVSVIFGKRDEVANLNHIVIRFT